ncbi:hypothetical protein ACLOJK_024148, partial [Asimina triloba]
SVDVVSGSVAEPVASIEGRSIKAVVLDSDEGSSGNSSVGKHVPTCDADDHQNTVSEGLCRRDCPGGSSTSLMLPLDINVEFIEPFWELEFIKNLDGVEDPDDLDYLLKQCGDLEQSV